MRVGRVEAFAVRYPEPNNDGKIRALTLVRVETDDGLVGWGEAITGGQEASLAVAFVVERRLAPLVVGRDPRDVAGVWSRLRDATYWDGNGGHGHVRHQRHRHGALGHRRARPPGVPLYRLLGGKRRDRVPACASTIFATHDLDRVGREFRGFVAEGYRYVKGGWGHDLSIAFGQRRAARSGRSRAPSATRSGPDVHMIVDVAALMGWDSSHAIRMCRAIDDDVRLYWFEDPLVEQDLDGYRRLHAAVDTRICTGEKGWHAAHYRAPHRVGRDRRHHDRPGPGGGRDRDLAHHRDGGGGRARLERALLEQRAQHRGGAPPRRRRVQHAHLRAQARSLADAARARHEPDRPRGRLGRPRPRGPASASPWTRLSCAATGSARTGSAAERGRPATR